MKTSKSYKTSGKREELKFFKSAFPNFQLNKKPHKFSRNRLKTDVDAFPGKISNDKSDKYVNGTPGLFVKSVPGTKPTNYIEKAFEKSLKIYMAKK